MDILPLQSHAISWRDVAVSECENSVDRIPIQWTREYLFPLLFLDCFLTSEGGVNTHSTLYIIYSRRIMDATHAGDISPGANEVNPRKIVFTFFICSNRR